jgi:uncharacterized membrane protein
LSFWSTYLGKIIMTFLISMVPVVELRGAIPIGVAKGLPIITSVIVSILGNLLPVPFIIIFIKRIFKWLRTKSERLNSFVTKMEERAEKKSDIVNKYAFWGLAVLVAIPLPGTGAWTGALVAAMMEMKLNKAFPSIAIGVVAAGIIVAVITYGVKVIV